MAGKEENALSLIIFDEVISFKEMFFKIKSVYTLLPPSKRSFLFFNGQDSTIFKDSSVPFFKHLP